MEALKRKKLLVIDFVEIDRSEIEESGDYDLEGLFVRLDHAIASIGAKRVVLDTLEALFSGFTNEAVLRSELRRLFRWLKDRGVTAVITGERGDGVLTRYGLEEYVSDCVILLDNRVDDQVATRRLRVVKYRGSAHGTNEYPFLIDEHGLLGLAGDQPRARLPGLDRARLDGRAAPRRHARRRRLLPRLQRAHLRHRRHRQEQPRRAVRRRELPARRARLYFALEESSAAGRAQHALDRARLQQWVTKRAARISKRRGRRCSGSEMHLVAMHKAVEQLRGRAPSSSIRSRA